MFNRGIRNQANMNATINGSSCTSPFNTTTEKIGKTFTLYLISVVSLVGNFFVILIVYKTKAMRKPINYFIVNLAMSDLVFSIFGFLTEDVDTWALDGTLGQTWCTLSIFLLYMSGCLSIQSLVLVAVDRFGAVVFPLRSPLISSKKCPYLIVASWIFELALFSPLVYYYTRIENSGKLGCQWRSNKTSEKSSSTSNYRVALIVVYFCIPMALLIILYSIILYKLKSQKIPGEQSVNAQEQRKKRNRNVLNMAIAIVSAFFICWMPFSVVKLISYSKWNSSLGCSFLLYRYITRIMTRANCAINPLICFIFSSNFRQGLKRLFKCFGAMQD